MFILRATVLSWRNKASTSTDGRTSIAQGRWPSVLGLERRPRARQRSDFKLRQNCRTLKATTAEGNAFRSDEARWPTDTIIYEVPPGRLPTTLPDGFWYRCLSGDVDNRIINGLVAYSLGYIYNGDKEVWETDFVPKEWIEAFPDGEPPDFIGISKEYSAANDTPVKKAIQMLQRSLPTEYRQFLQRRLTQFKGYQIGELTPEKTRRAQCINFLLARIDMQEKGLLP